MHQEATMMEEEEEDPFGDVSVELGKESEAQMQELRTVIAVVMAKGGSYGNIWHELTNRCQNSNVAMRGLTAVYALSVGYRATAGMNQGFQYYELEVDTKDLHKVMDPKADKICTLIPLLNGGGVALRIITTSDRQMADGSCKTGVGPSKPT